MDRKKKLTCMILSVAMLLVFGFAENAFAKKHKKPEKNYQREWCEKMGGKAEVRMPDGTRCDCLLEKFAVEFDFGPKWAEAIGQAMYYGLQTGKLPGIVLILESKKDNIFWIRLNSTILHYRLPIKTWKIENY
jgi:hypothetical protein